MGTIGGDRPSRCRHTARTTTAFRAGGRRRHLDGIPGQLVETQWNDQYPCVPPVQGLRVGRCPFGIGGRWSPSWPHPGLTRPPDKNKQTRSMTEAAPLRRRYVPKGGYLVDFSERVTPKLRRLLERERRAAGEEGTPQERQVPAQEPDAQTQQSVRNENQGSECMDLVVWSGHRGGQARLSMTTTDAPRLATPSASSPDRSCSPSPASFPSESSTDATDLISRAPQSRSSWKPPGCLRQSLWKRPIKPVKKARAPAPRPPPAATEDTCPSCAALSTARGVLHQHQHALHMGYGIAAVI